MKFIRIYILTHSAALTRYIRSCLRSPPTQSFLYTWFATTPSPHQGCVRLTIFPSAVASVKLTTRKIQKISYSHSLTYLFVIISQPKTRSVRGPVVNFIAIPYFLARLPSHSYAILSTQIDSVQVTL